MSSAMTEPQNAAKALLDDYPGLHGLEYGRTGEPIILAIEHQAADAALAALAETVAAMTESLAPSTVGWGPLPGAVDRAAVLDAIATARKETT